MSQVVRDGGGSSEKMDVRGERGVLPHGWLLVRRLWGGWWALRPALREGLRIRAPSFDVRPFGEHCSPIYGSP